MPISCEECRNNLGQLLSAHGLSSLPPSDATASDAISITSHASPQASTHAHTDKKPGAEHKTEIGEVEAHEVEAHLASCEACSSELARLRRMVGALHDLPVLPAPVDLRARIQSQLRIETAPISTHATAWKADITQAASEREPRDTQVASSRINRDLARGWSGFWTRALRHPARATWAGGAILCALALVVASRAPDSFSPATRVSNKETTAASARLPAPSKQPNTAARSANRSVTAKTTARNSEPPKTSSSQASASSKTASSETAPSGTAAPARPMPGATQATAAHDEHSAAFPTPTDSARPLRAPSNPDSPLADSPLAVQPSPALPGADMSTHGAARSAAPDQVREKPASASAAEPSSPPRDKQVFATRLARLELLPVQAAPLAPASPDSTLHDVPASVPSSVAGASSTDSHQAYLQRTSPARSQASDEETASRLAPSTKAQPARSSSLQADTSSSAAPSAATTSNGAAMANKGSFRASGSASPLGSASSPRVLENRNGIASAEMRREGSEEAAIADATLPSQTGTTPGSAGRTPGSAGRTLSGDFGAASGRLSRGRKKSTQNELRLSKSQRADAARSANEAKRIGKARTVAQPARLWITPARNASTARVRVSLFGLAWSDANRVSTSSQPRIVWRGQAKRGSEIAISLSLAPSTVALGSRANTMLRVELQQARGKQWETTQAQNLPVALP